MRAKASDVLTAEVLRGRARSRARLGLEDEEEAAGAAGGAAAAEQGARGGLAGAGAPRDKVSPRATSVRGDAGGIAMGSHRGGGGAGGGTGLGSSGGGDSLAEHATIQMAALGGAAASDPLGEGSATSLLRRGGGGGTIADGGASGAEGKRRRGSVRSSPLSLSVVTAALRSAAEGGGARTQHAEPPRVFWCEAFASEPGRAPDGAAASADGGTPGAGGGSARKRRLPSATGPAQAREVFEWLLAVAI